MKNTETTLPKTALTNQSNCRTGQFYFDVVCGLNASPKYLSSKYFYDAQGDKLFQDLMNCEEYYPTNCEMEIFSEQTADVCRAFNLHYSPLNSAGPGHDGVYLPGASR